MRTTGGSMRALAIALAGIAISMSPREAEAQLGRDVIFQHGFNSDGTTWSQEATALQNYLEITSSNFSTDWHHTFSDQAAQLTGWLTGADADAVFIGHSAGGLVGRVANMPAPYPGRSWGGVITVGTPHTGAPLATAVAGGDVGNWLNDALWDASDAFSYYQPYVSYQYLEPVWAATSWLVTLGANISTFATTIGGIWGNQWPISADLQPGAPILWNTLNKTGAGSNIAREQTAIPVRIGIASVVSTNTGLPFHAVFSDWQNWQNTKSVILGAFDAAAAAAASYGYGWGCQPPNAACPDQQDINNNAWRWTAAADDLAWFDSVWCLFIGAVQGSTCGPSDAVVPATRAHYPDETGYVELSGPSHFEETTSSELDDELKRLLHETFSIPLRPPPPPTYSAVIQGTYDMQPGESCHWSAFTDVEDPEYQWQVNGVVVGSGPDLYYSSSSSFTLELDAWNFGTGHNAYDIRDIDVSEENFPCADQLRKRPTPAIRPE